MKFRLYIDETGNAGLRSTADPSNRFLSLTGVIFELGYVRDVVFPTLEEFKRKLFSSHPDDPVILHRKEIVNRKPPFEALRVACVEEEFNDELLKMIRTFKYEVMTVIIDKHEHLTRYKVWRRDPYYYCLAVMLERYVFWLKRRQACGDVLAESRGGKEDRRLKKSFSYVWNNGTDFVDAAHFHRHLTSAQLKVKAKANNIAGLQFADLLAHPCFRMAHDQQHDLELPANFGTRIAKVIKNSKYLRSPEGKVDGWGLKWLP